MKKDTLDETMRPVCVREGKEGTMRWKKVWSQERKCFGEVDKYMLVPTLRLEGRKIRVTVEEEVDECCETWRILLWTDQVTDSPGKKFFRLGFAGKDCVGPVVFCPTCGKRL